jgi:hypothetical protein
MIPIRSFGSNPTVASRAKLCQTPVFAGPGCSTSVTDQRVRLTEGRFFGGFRLGGIPNH